MFAIAADQVDSRHGPALGQDALALVSLQSTLELLLQSRARRSAEGGELHALLATGPTQAEAAARERFIIGTLASMIWAGACAVPAVLTAA